MSRPEILNILKSAISRGWFLYLLIILAGCFLVDLAKMSAHAKPTTLSRLRPDYGFIGQFALGAVPFNRKALEDQRVYLENVNGVMGVRPDTAALLGYVYYQLGNTKSAEASFKQASELNPSFFWNYFDLAVLAFESGDDQKAGDWLQRALKLDPQLSVRFILTSRVLIPLVEEGRVTPPMFMERLLQGRADAHKMLVQIEFLNGQYEEAITQAQGGLQAALTGTDRAFFLYYMGAAALKIGAVPMAIKAFEECLKLDPSSPDALEGLARLLQGIGKTAEADVFVQQARFQESKGAVRIAERARYQVKAF